MRMFVAAVVVTAGVAAMGPTAHAQSAIDHNVQRTWDNIFNPPPPGDPRTNWERRRDAERAQERRNDERAAYDRRREADHYEWCRYHPDAAGCGRY